MTRPLGVNRFFELSSLDDMGLCRLSQFVGSVSGLFFELSGSHTAFFAAPLAPDAGNIVAVKIQNTTFLFNTKNNE